MKSIGVGWKILKQNGHRPNEVEIRSYEQKDCRIEMKLNMNIDFELEIDLLTG